MGMVTMTTDKMQKCIDICNSCAQGCYECFEACLNEPDISERRNCIKTLIECAKMCELSASAMSMNGSFAKAHCAMCVTICEACADNCRIFKDEHCIKCAALCRSCAAECRIMSDKA